VKSVSAPSKTARPQPLPPLEVAGAPMALVGFVRKDNMMTGSRSLIPLAPSLSFLLLWESLYRHSQSYSWNEKIEGRGEVFQGYENRIIRLAKGKKVKGMKKDD